MSLRILLVAHLLINVVSLFFLIRDGSRPYRIWAWMMTIFAIPLFGAIIFLLFGVNRRKRKLFDAKKITDDQQWEEYLQNYQAENPTTNLDALSPGHQRLSRLIANTAKSPLTFNNEIDFLTDGRATYDSIIAACKEAQEFILIQFYIFEEGSIAREIAEVLEERIESGVQVYVLVDAIGSWSLSKNYIKRLEKAGVHFHQFLPLRLGALGRTNYRNHRKIVVIDGHTAFTGGINVHDKYIDGDQLGLWTDAHLKIHGEAVNFLQFTFYCDWYFASEENLFEILPIETVLAQGRNAVQIVASGPDSDHANILTEIVQIISAAQNYIYIANPYLIPNESLLLALRSAALSGVDVRIVIPQRSDYHVTMWAVRSYFEDLLVSGVRIFLHQHGFLHAKLIISDDAVCSVGTANLDIRSFEQNFEVNTVIYNTDTTLELKNQFFKYLDESQEVDLGTYLSRPRRDRIRENLARLVSPLM